MAEMITFRKPGRKSAAKAGAAVLIFLAFAGFFYGLFRPYDIPSFLTYALFFVLVPAYGVYYLSEKLIDRFIREKSAAPAEREAPEPVAGPEAK
jgi:hypothetical protein